MRTYSERFKKELVKKVLTPGIHKKDVCKKLNLYEKTVTKWIRQYRHEVEVEAEDQVLDAIQPEKEEEIDIDKLLAEYDRKDMSAEEVQQEQSIDRILEKGKHPSEYNRQEKYVMVDTFRRLPSEEQGIFFRRSGIQSKHIKLWEEELLEMGKKHVDKDAYIKRLEEKNRRLEKELKETSREKKELKILIGLKKKYQNLFKEDGED